MGILMEAAEVNVGTAGYRRQVQLELFGAMGAPGEYYADGLHSIAINTRESEFGSIVEPIPITLKAYKQYQTHERQINSYGFSQQPVLTSLASASRIHEVALVASTANFEPSPVKDEEMKEAPKVTRPPPKKKWIRDYLEEEPKSPVSVRVVTGLPVAARSNGVVRAPSPLAVAVPCAPAPVLPAAAPTPAPPALVPAAPLVTLEPVAPAPLLDFAQQHSRPRTTSISHGPPQQIPSPPSVGSNGSVSSGSNGSSSNSNAPRAGTREVHNKLEKNRRAHLKECFELLKRQLPATPDDKKTSNLSILRSAIRYIQVLRRKERDCEHEMERLAREKIAAQQRLSALKREISVRTTVRPRSIDPVSDDKDREDTLNAVLGIPMSISASPPRCNVSRMETSPPRTLNLSTKLRTLPIQITPTTSQVVRTTYGTRPNTLTLTTLAPADHSTQNGQAIENGVTNALGTTLVHPAQIHLPISQVVGSGGLVVGGALQLLSAGGPLRVLQAPINTNGVSSGENGRIPKENGIVSSNPVTTTEGVVVSGLGPLMVSQPAAHLLHTHTLTHKMVETQMVKGSVAPLTVSAQYLSATTIMKPVVVVSSAGNTAPGAPNT